MRLSPQMLGELLRAPAPGNRLRVLQAVSEHGHLCCVNLAAACWPGAKFGEQMAQHNVRVLVERGELEARANALGGTSFVLTRPGDAALEVRGIAAHYGLDLAASGPTFRHTALTSRWCIHKQAEGFKVFTEYAIANGRAPLSREVVFKRLGRHVDAVLIKGDKVYACETESAVKATADLMRIAAMAEHVGDKVHPDMPYVPAGVFIAFDAGQNHGARIARAARERWMRYGAAEQAILAGRITLARVALGLPLVWRGCSEARWRCCPNRGPCKTGRYTEQDNSNDSMRSPYKPDSEALSFPQRPRKGTLGFEGQAIV